jgi:hypothetical protein
MTKCPPGGRFGAPFTSAAAGLPCLVILTQFPARLIISHRHMAIGETGRYEEERP